MPTLIIIISWLMLGQVPDGSPSPEEPLPRRGRRIVFCPARCWWPVITPEDADVLHAAGHR